MSSVAAPVQISHHAWYREGEVVALVVLVFFAYFTRIDLLSVRGEESRWATIAVDMLRTGDFVVPRQQAEPFLSRPPLGNWLIAGTTFLLGRCDALAIRLPTVTALLLTTLLIYAYGRTFLGRLGAFAAAAAFPTFGEMLQMGRFGESDTVFASLLSAAFMLWQWGYAAGWPRLRTWCVAYLLAALAALQKGPQAPAYFVGTTIAYLVLRGDWRYLWSRAHLAGIVLFALVLAAWQLPFYRALGWEAVKGIWLSDGAIRYRGGMAVVVHLFVYPVELIGVTMPWSLLLAAYLSRRFRCSLRAAVPAVQFHAVALAVAFLPCWLMSGGMTRYMMPLYPSLALLSGVVVQRAVEVGVSRRLRAAFHAGRWLLAIGIGVIALGVIVAALGPLPDSQSSLRQPLGIALVLAFIGTAFVVVSLVHGAKPQRWPVRLAVGSLAAFLALAYGGVVVNILQARSYDAAERVARFKEMLPADHRLVSFRPVHHLFAYLYAEPIEVRNIPGENGYDGRDVTYFCYWTSGNSRMPLPFPSEELAVIPIDRSRGQGSKEVVVVGRRLSEQVGKR